MENSLLLASPPVTGRLGAMTTERLDLRPVDRESVERLEPVFAKTEVWRYPYGRPFSRADTEAFV